MFPGEPKRFFPLKLQLIAASHHFIAASHRFIAASHHFGLRCLRRLRQTGYIAAPGVEAFKATGVGWQSRMNDALAEAAKRLAFSTKVVDFCDQENAPPL